MVIKLDGFQELFQLYVRDIHYDTSQKQKSSVLINFSITVIFSKKSSIKI